jgi:hypothetical protein
VIKVFTIKPQTRIGKDESGKTNQAGRIGKDESGRDEKRFSEGSATRSQTFSMIFKKFSKTAHKLLV